MPPAAGAGASRIAWFSRRAGAGLLALIAILIAARAVLPSLILRKANRELSDPRLEDYAGRVEDVDLALWRGAYRVEGFRLDRKTGGVPVPFVTAERVDITVEWKALLRGRLVSEIEVLRPKVNFVKGPTPAQSLT